MKEGGASKEFYMSELVTHVISDLLVDPESLPVTGHDYVTVNVRHIITSRSMLAYAMHSMICTL